MPFRCCVRSCSFKNMLHRFPQNAELVKSWCQAIGREDLIEKGTSFVRNNYRVCDAHFDQDAKFPTHHNRTNLKVGSVPTVNLPVNQVQSLSMQSVVDEPEPVTMHTSSDASSTSTLITGEVGKKRTSKVKGVLLMKRRNLLLEVKLRNKAQLTPKAAKLYEIAKEYRKAAQQMNYEVETNKDLVKKAIKLAETGNIFQSKINDTTFKFLQSQISQQVKKPKGRRFTHEDKVLSLALLKQSPKSYKLLRKIFALPSRKTLMAMMAKIPFGYGINQPIFDSLGESVKNFKPSDKHCILMSDEMSLQPSLSYNKSREYIDGFQDTGPENLSQKIADHAMVFMIKGLAKNWKQPVAYFFSQNGMSNAEIAKNVKEIIKQLSNVGIIVDATVCDQYNKAAINSLVEETRRNAGRMGNQHETYTFKVGKGEISIIYLSSVFYVN